MKIAVFLSLLLTGSSFSAVSLLNKQAMSEEFKVEEKVVQGDPSLGAVKAFNEGNYLAAVLRARSLAEEGNMYGLLVMGLAYEKGKGIEPSTELALTNYRKAREAGSGEAAYRLVGLLISAGSDDQRKEAREVLESLVKDDDGKAARLIGEGMLKGWFGGDPEFNKIQSWWEAAAEKRDVSAMIGLARLHDGEFGFPEKRNPQSALQEYQRAAKWGHAPAMTILGARLGLGSTGIGIWSDEDGLGVVFDLHHHAAFERGFVFERSEVLRGEVIDRNGPEGFGDDLDPTIREVCRELGLAKPPSPASRGVEKFGLSRVFGGDVIEEAAEDEVL